MNDAKSVTDVLDIFNAVFAGEKAYDEALMELDLHVALVRKQYPALYNALQSFGSFEQSGQQQATRYVESVVHANGGIRQPVQVADEPPQEEIFLYSEWSKLQGKMPLPKGVSHLVQWDNDARMFGVGEPLTLRGSQARFRWQVLEVENDVMRVTQVAVLPLG